MNCKMLLIGEAWGREEAELQGRVTQNALVGAAGKLLFEMLGLAKPDFESQLHARAMRLARRDSIEWLAPRDEWLSAAGIQLANVLNFRPPDNSIPAICLSKDELPFNYPREIGEPIARHPKAIYLKPEYLVHVLRLYDKINDLRPNMVVPMGNTACWATLRATNIGYIRGTITQTSHPSIHPARKALPVFHPAALLHSSMKGLQSKAVSIADYIKAFREAEFSEIKRPVRFVTVNPTIEECEHWTLKVKTLASQGEIEWLSCDIETAKRTIKCISFAYSDYEGFVFPFWPDERESYWPSAKLELRAWDCVSDLLALHVPKLGQNFLYDTQYLLEAPLREPIWMEKMEDSMLLHHSLYPEMPKSLGFLASIYTNEVAWKLMRRRRPDSEKRDE